MANVVCRRRDGVDCPHGKCRWEACQLNWSLFQFFYSATPILKQRPISDGHQSSDGHHRGPLRMLTSFVWWLRHNGIAVCAVVIISVIIKYLGRMSVVWTPCQFCRKSTADTVTADTVTADTVTADTVTADTVTADTVTADTVTADTVTADTVTADTVTADTVTADTVTARQTP